MTVKQISVFLENKPGQLSGLTKHLQENKIDIRALSIADSKDFGILRIIVDDPYKTVCVLKEADYVCSVTPVLAVEMPDRPGSIDAVLGMLGDGGVNLEYAYAFITRKKNHAYMIFRVADNSKAVEVLNKNGMKPICQDELSELFRE